jgi:hypothetical protein
MTLDEWVAAVCVELGIEVPQAKTVLDFARDVAHRVDRPAAPLTCLLVGLAASSTDDVAVVMDRVRALLPPEAEVS